MKNLFYYHLEQAEEIRQTYNSWVGKNAHVGLGVTETLRSITIKPKKIKKGNLSSTLYTVEFKFDGNKKFSAHEFLFYNGLIRHPVNGQR